MPGRALQADAAQALTDQYAQVVASRRAVEHAVAGHRWSAWVGGAGPRTLLLLPGSTRVPHTYFQLVAALEPRMRVVAVSYPPAATMQELAEGLVGLLDRLGVRRADVFGSSLGGFVALTLARHAPERVGRVVLANTAPPTPGLARRFRWARRLLRPLPDPVLRRCTGLLWTRWIGTAPGTAGFWAARMRECLAGLTPADLRAQLDEMDDYGRHPIRPGDLARVEGPWLILESGHDNAIPAKAQAALRSLLPGATVARFDGAGHTALFAESQRYIGVVARFLTQAA